LHVTIEETDEGTLICLLLEPSETSSELRDFVSSLPGPSLSAPSQTSTRRPTDLRSEGLVPLANLDVGGARGPGAPSRDEVVRALEASLAGSEPSLGGIIGRISRGAANVIPFQEGETISESLAIRTRQTIPEVHARLSLPLLRLPKVGPALVKALSLELRAEAVQGKVGVLDRTRVIYEAALEKVLGRPKFLKGRPVPPDLAEGRLKTLLTNLRTSRILAQRVREEP